MRCARNFRCRSPLAHRISSLACDDAVPIQRARMSGLDAREAGVLSRIVYDDLDLLEEAYAGLPGR
jgi:hypothetical protein